jgi:hypothetical protein
MKWRPIVLASACVPLLLSALVSAAWADEIRLKDGSKIIGTIVGYEDDAFKVETTYGFALVRKNSIAEIVPSEPKTRASENARRSLGISFYGRRETRGESDGGGGAWSDAGALGGYVIGNAAARAARTANCPASCPAVSRARCVAQRAVKRAATFTCRCAQGYD